MFSTNQWMEPHPGRTNINTSVFLGVGTTAYFTKTDAFHDAWSLGGTFPRAACDLVTSLPVWVVDFSI